MLDVNHMVVAVEPGRGYVICVGDDVLEHLVYLLHPDKLKVVILDKALDIALEHLVGAELVHAVFIDVLLQALPRVVAD